MHIPIQNIYYLLCYAWNKLEEQDQAAVSIDDQTSLLDLFAKVLNNATRILLKRGIDRSYVEQTTEISGIKGKLAISETLKRNILHQQRTVCVFDEFSPDILTNQILVSTLRKLIRVKPLDKGLKLESRQLLYMFPGIRPITIKPSHFKQIRLNRNNRFYHFIIKVCEIIHQNILPGEEAGTYQFADFTRDERKMNQLFEHFVFNFYRLEQNTYKVKRDNIHWQFETEDDLSKSHLPRMQTDITLISNDEKIIIDAKYYRETMSAYYGSEKIKSGNLYQLFSYLMNQESDDPKTKRTKGILLYPTIEKEYDLKYAFRDHPIEIRTVNLNDDWRRIRKRLLEII